MYLQNLENADICTPIFLSLQVVWLQDLYVYRQHWIFFGEFMGVVMLPIIDINHSSVDCLSQGSFSP